MNLKQFKTEMETLGYNINYLMFTNPPQLPYLVYYVAENNYQYSDNKNYSLFLGVNLELYDKNKNIEAENKIENKLNELVLKKKLSSKVIIHLSQEIDELQNKLEQT